MLVRGQVEPSSLNAPNFAAPKWGVLSNKQLCPQFQVACTKAVRTAFWVSLQVAADTCTTLRKLRSNHLAYLL